MHAHTHTQVPTSDHTLRLDSLVSSLVKDAAENCLLSTLVRAIKYWKGASKHNFWTFLCTHALRCSGHYCSLKYKWRTRRALLHFIGEQSQLAHLRHNGMQSVYPRGVNHLIIHRASQHTRRARVQVKRETGRSKRRAFSTAVHRRAEALATQRRLLLLVFQAHLIAPTSGRANNSEQNLREEHF